MWSIEERLKAYNKFINDKRDNERMGYYFKLAQNQKFRHKKYFKQYKLGDYY